MPAEMKCGPTLNIARSKKNIAICDWKDNPGQVANAINKLLTEHGIELISHDQDGDYYAFTAQKIKKAK